MQHAEPLLPPAVPAHALALGQEGPAVLGELLSTAVAALSEGAAERGGPVPAGAPGELAGRWEARLGTPLPEQGAGATAALAQVTRLLAAGAADPADPACAGHLHCPPLAVAVAADMAASALNPSLDSWDQAPAATTVERSVIGALAGLAGYDPATASGVVTTGGTESNLMGLLLARDHAVTRHFGLSAARTGVPSGARPRVLCSRAAHFSVARAAGFIGLGEDAVIAVPTDSGHRMDPSALDEELTALRHRGEIPVAIVATAGTTDLGAVDPLPRIAALAARHGTRLHVDAAYGGGALFSERLRPLLAGLAEADTITLDLHKFGWQPVASGVFLTRDAADLDPLGRQVAYLNPEDDEEAGYTSLLGHSLRTTRRADAAKIAVTLKALGRTGLGAMVDRCHDLALHAARAVAGHPRLDLYAPPTLSTVVFRYLPEGAPEDVTDAVNARLRRRLLAEGRAVVGRTTAPHPVTGREAVYVKLTLLNPDTTPGTVDALVEAVARAGAAEAP
ncbi:pyridoxal phosphate-dependent decarboxylase family protein [Streptomyces albireticuli]|uniref:pyridoxal phosphate-dependent decarboxylase family protein n=1 Tax=Streptomyces albireticuli TaxID=1940 RepID=UPI001E378B22|nr:pyridoxal-dependent decarboxylase [Streptomyces albireticuli]MCD9194313.1 pyridoxal-dependent decarboxylase [Streptomyces albireticuli]